MGWPGGICLPIYPSILEGTCTCTVPKGPLRASTFFWRGSFFLCFFLDRVGELAAAAEKCFGSFYIFFFGGGVFGTAAAKSTAGFYLALPLSFPVGRVCKREEKEKRERQYKVYFPTIFFRPRREKKREGHFEKLEEKVLFFLYLYIYIYILFSCI